MCKTLLAIPACCTALLLFAATARAQDCWRPDAFDAPGPAPAAITPGSYSRLTLQELPFQPGSAHDLYSIVLPAQSRLVLDVIPTSEFSPPTFAGTAYPPTLGFDPYLGGSFQVEGSAAQQVWRVYSPHTFGIFPPQHVEPHFENATGSAQNVRFSVTADPATLALFGCVEYSLSVSIITRPCNVVGDDALEGADDCTSAALLPVGLSTDLVVFDATAGNGADQDYYRITNVAPGEAIVLSLIPHDADPVPIGVRLTDDPSCGETLAVGKEGFARNDTANPKDYFVYVNAWTYGIQGGSERDGCKAYDLHLTRVPGECGTLPVDAFEPNDSCASSAVLTPGVYPALTLDGNAEDFYEVVVPADHRLRARIDATTVEAALTLSFGVAPNCPVCCDFGADGIDYSNTTGSPRTIRLLVGSRNAMCSEYALDVIVDPLPCTTGYQPDLVPGPNCATATDFPAGWHAFIEDEYFESSYAYDKFAIEPGDEHFFGITVPPGEVYVASLGSFPDTLSFSGIPDDGCGGSPLQSKFDAFSGQQYLALPNRTPLPIRYAVRVAGATVCQPYTLAYNPDSPCYWLDEMTGVLAQSHDDCAAAVLVPEGAVGYQTISSGRSKFVRTSVPAGRTLTAGVSRDSLAGLGSEVLMQFHDGLADCDSGGATLGSATLMPDGSVHQLQYLNASAQSREVTIELRLADSVHNCGMLWLDIELESGAAYTTECLGLRASGLACPCDNELPTQSGGGCANSAGLSGHLAASGSNSLQVDDLRLEVSGLPSHRMGVVLSVSQHFANDTVGQLYFDGKLCIGGNGFAPMIVSRMQSTSQGTWLAPFRLAGTIEPQPGSTSRVQVWFRDNGGPCATGSNTTNSIRVDWQP